MKNFLRGFGMTVLFLASLLLLLGIGVGIVGLFMWGMTVHPFYALVGIVIAAGIAGGIKEAFDYKEF